VVWKVQEVMQVVMMEVVDLELVLQPSTPEKALVGVVWKVQVVMQVVVDLELVMQPSTPEKAGPRMLML
jgi:hypothetical protein